MKTGEKIKRIRLEKKIKQEEIADALNITQRAYSKIENNEVQIKINRLEQIAKILNTDPRNLLPEVANDELIDNSKSGILKRTDSNEKIIHLYEKIISRQQDEINYLKGLVDIFKR